MKQVKSKQFHKDFELNTYTYANEEKSELKLPPITKQFEADSFKKIFEFKKCIINHAIKVNEQSAAEVTEKLIAAHKATRLKIFNDLARTKAALRSKEFFRRFKNPSETIGVRGKRSLLCRVTRKPKKYCFDEWAIRNAEELAIERHKIRAHLKHVIEADLERVKKEEAKKSREAELNKIKQEQAKRKMQLKQIIKNLPNEEYMRRLKKREKM